MESIFFRAWGEPVISLNSENSGSITCLCEMLYAKGQLIRGIIDHTRSLNLSKDFSKDLDWQLQIFIQWDYRLLISHKNFF